MIWIHIPIISKSNISLTRCGWLSLKKSEGSLPPVKQSAAFEQKARAFLIIITWKNVLQTWPDLKRIILCLFYYNYFSLLFQYAFYIAYIYIHNHITIIITKNNACAFTAILCCAIKTAAAVFLGNATEMQPLRPPNKRKTFKYTLRVARFFFFESAGVWLFIIYLYRLIHRGCGYPHLFF